MAWWYCGELAETGRAPAMWRPSHMLPAVASGVSLSSGSLCGMRSLPDDPAVRREWLERWTAEQEANRSPTRPGRAWVPRLAARWRARRLAMARRGSIRVRAIGASRLRAGARLWGQPLSPSTTIPIDWLRAIALVDAAPSPPLPGRLRSRHLRRLRMRQGSSRPPGGQAPLPARDRRRDLPRPGRDRARQSGDPKASAPMPERRDRGRRRKGVPGARRSHGRLFLVSLHG